MLDCSSIHAWFYMFLDFHSYKSLTFWSTLGKLGSVCSSGCQQKGFEHNHPWVLSYILVECPIPKGDRYINLTSWQFFLEENLDFKAQLGQLIHAKRARQSIVRHHSTFVVRCRANLRSIISFTRVVKMSCCNTICSKGLVFFVWIILSSGGFYSTMLMVAILHQTQVKT